MTDGHSIQVPQGEFLSHSPTGRTILVYHADESFRIIDLLLVNEIEVQRTSVAGSHQQN